MSIEHLSRAVCWRIIENPSSARLAQIHYFISQKFGSIVSETPDLFQDEKPGGRTSPKKT